LPRLAAVTPEQAQRVAALYFRETNRTVGWLVPRSGTANRNSGTQHGDTETRRVHFGERGERRGLSSRSTLHRPRQQLFRHTWPDASSDRPAPPKKRGIRGITSQPLPSSSPCLRVSVLKTVGTPFRPLPVLRRVLPNGLRVLLLENHALPLFTAVASVRAGSRDETEAQAGLAHFTAATLDAGTTSRSDLEIAHTLEGLGVALEASPG